MGNKYVDYVTDEHFEECVKWVINGYTQKRDIRQNGVDAFKTIFDITQIKVDFEQWKVVELKRSADKNISNKIGEFHQKLLGGVEGWCDLKIGDVADLSNDSKTIFLELKNKHNTVKGADMIGLWKRLDKITKNYPKSIAYWAYINSKDGSSGEDVWKYQNKSNPKVKKIWGKNIYELITGKKNALTETLYALPKAISNVTDNSKILDIENDENLTKWLNDSF